MANDPKVSLCVLTEGSFRDPDVSFYRAKVSTFRAIGKFIADHYGAPVKGKHGMELPEVDELTEEQKAAFLSQFKEGKARTEVGYILDEALDCWYSMWEGWDEALTDAANGEAGMFQGDDMVFVAFGPTNAAARAALEPDMIPEDDDESEDY